jgi:hypothetical protein
MLKSMVSFIQLKPILDKFLWGFSLSSCPQHSLKILTLLNSTCLSKYVLNLERNFSYFIFRFGLSDVRINCNRNSEGFLLYLLRLSGTEFTWYIAHHLAYCASLEWYWMMMSVEQSVECLAGETKLPRENLPQCHFVHHKSHMTWHGLETGPPSEENLQHNILYIYIKYYKYSQNRLGI